MPTKRRITKTRRAYTITPEAVARWREVRPGGIEDNMLTDPALADAVGLPPLLTLFPQDVDGLAEALESATRRSGPCR